MTRQLLNIINKTITRAGLLQRRDRVLLAVSGGPDSVFMVLVFKEYLQKQYNLKLFIAHFNHQLRGLPADRDAAFVRRLARRLELPYYEKSVAVRKLKKPRQSLEAVARDARYAFLKKTAQKLKCQKIATAHHRDDAVETLLLRLLAATGRQGLRGLLAKREDRVIRPLLDVEKSQILDYLRSRRIAYCTDATNSDESHRRNRIRRRLVPFIKENFGPGALRNLAKSCANLAMEAGPAAPPLLLRTEESGFSLAVSSLAGLTEAQLLAGLRRLCQEGLPAGFSPQREFLLDLAGLLKKGRSSQGLDGPAGYRFQLEKGRLLVRRLPASGPLPAGPVPLKFPGVTRPAAWGLRIKTSLEKIPRPLAFPAADAAEAWLDADQVAPPLVLRGFKPGDRFWPLGAAGPKKLGDFFTDHKIPGPGRGRRPLLCDRNRILWVTGLRICHPGRVTPETRRLLRIRIAALPS